MSGTWSLAIVTSTPQVSVALAGADGVIGAVTLRTGRRHGETLAPALEFLTRSTGITLGVVERVAVDTGPGLFTGLRVGVATAKALGSALGVPVVPCSSLDLLAHPHRGCRRMVASVVDARRGEVFWALYEPIADGMVAITDAVAQAPDEVSAALTETPDVLLSGDGARRYLSAGPFELAPAGYDHPSATVLAELALTRPGLPAEKVTPTYLRGADVRIGWEQR